MSNPLIQVADAIAKEINAAAGEGVFGDVFSALQAVRSYSGRDMCLRETGVLRVDVVPSAWKTDLASRGAVLHTISCDVGVRYKFPEDFQGAESGTIENAPVDDLVNLLRQVFEYFMPATDTGSARRLEDLPQAVWESTEVKAPFIPEHLDEFQQYTGIVTVTFFVHE